MKKNVIKTAIAAVCVVATGVSGMKAYNANLSKANMLLEENVEALSLGDVGSLPPCGGLGQCYVPGYGEDRQNFIW